MDQRHESESLNYKTLRRWDFPGGAEVKNPPANAGYTGSSPGLVRSHRSPSNKARAPQLLSPRVTTTEACAPRACAPQREATTMRSRCTTTKSSPRSPQLEKACVQQRRPNAAKYIHTYIYTYIHTYIKLLEENIRVNHGHTEFGNRILDMILKAQATK